MRTNQYKERRQEGVGLQGVAGADKLCKFSKLQRQESKSKQKRHTKPEQRLAFFATAGCYHPKSAGKAAGKQDQGLGQGLGQAKQVSAGWSTERIVVQYCVDRE